MNPVRKIQMEKRYKKIGEDITKRYKELEEIFMDPEHPSYHHLKSISIGLLLNLFDQQVRVERLMELSRLDVFANQLRRDEIRRQMGKPPSPETIKMMKYEMSPERVAARTKEFEEHKKESYE